MADEARTIWVVEVEWKRRKGKPVEPVAITSGGLIQALFLAKQCAERLKVPQSWVEPVLYQRMAGNDSAGGAVAEVRP